MHAEPHRDVPHVSALKAWQPHHRAAGDSAPPAKKRKTTAEKRADAERKAALAAAPLDPEAPFVLHQRQPWAEKERQARTEMASNEALQMYRWRTRKPPLEHQRASQLTWFAPDPACVLVHHLPASLLHHR